MVMMVTDGTRDFVWTCPHCGSTKASATKREHEANKTRHRPKCQPWLLVREESR